MIYIIGAVVLWLIVMTVLLTPARTFSSGWDRLTRGNGRADSNQLKMMLDNLVSFPDQWSISKDQAAFPKEGAKQLYLNYDEKKGWEYSMPAFGSGSRPLDGFFGTRIQKALVEENARREGEAVLRMFYKDLDDPLRLT